MKANHSIDSGIREGEPPYRPAADVAANVAKPPWLTRRRLILVAVSVPLLALVWWVTAYPRGMLMAGLDCAFGHYELQTFGLPAP